MFCHIAFEHLDRAVFHDFFCNYLVLGLAAMFFLGTWAVFSFILSLCFSCNLLGILLLPQYEAFVDTTCDVLAQNLVSRLFVGHMTV